jgi:hypothetical protein
MERPRYIESIEQKEGVIFSEFNLGNVDIDGKKFNKLELVYVKDSYPTNNLREMIYSANKKEQIYLHVQEWDSNTRFSIVCYFLPEKMNVVEIYLRSLLNKKN